MSNKASLDVIVVGAGIGGLATAIALRKAGHNVKILERSALSREVGAAITVPPNASRILRAWGLDMVKARFVPYLAMQVVRADLTPVEEVIVYDHSAIEATWGAPYCTAHRVDLHEALRAMATGDDGPGKPAELVTSVAVESYDVHAGSVTLADGCMLMADLLVAADGVHSRAHKNVLGHERPAVPSGTTVIRFMIPTQTILQDPKTAPLLAGGNGQCSIYTAADELRWLVRYYCRDNELQNFGAYSSNNTEDSAIEEWNISANRDSLLQRLHGFDPAILEVCRKSTEILPLWKCADRAPLPRLHAGKLVLIGDAAHPMLPNMGQGAASALEDAAVLGVLFSDIQDLTEIPHRLRMFDDTRKDRVAAFQLFSSVPVGVDSYEAIEGRLKEYFAPEDIPKNKKETLAFCYAHDCMKEASKRLQDHLNDGAQAIGQGDC